VPCSFLGRVMIQTLGTRRSSGIYTSLHPDNISTRPGNIIINKINICRYLILYRGGPALYPRHHQLHAISEPVEHVYCDSLYTILALSSQRISGVFSMNPFGERFARHRHTGETQKLGPDLDANRTRLCTCCAHEHVCTAGTSARLPYNTVHIKP
jgi:hypothetical protein